MSSGAAAPRLYLITDGQAPSGAGNRSDDDDDDGDDEPARLVDRLRRALSPLDRGAGSAGPRLGGAAGTPRPSEIAVQLREKQLGGRALRDLAELVRGVTAAAGVGLFINDRVDVALAVGADGVHLGGGALTPTQVRSIAPHLQIAVSTHTIPEVARAAADPDVAFVVFGPVFDTPSKRATGRPPVGLAALAQAASVRIPVVALGGVDLSRVADCARAGAFGVGCIRSVLGATDPAAALIEMWRKWNENSAPPLDRSV